MTKFTLTARASDTVTGTVASKAAAFSVTGTTPLFGCNDGTAWSQPGYWHSVLASAGVPIGYRAYQRTMTAPTTWNQNLPAPSGNPASPPAWYCTDWVPSDVAGVIAGAYDAQLTSWAQSCQAFGGAGGSSPGRLKVSVFHEADAHIPMSQVVALHGHIYPLFRAHAPDVPYGQIFTAFHVGQSAGWVSCAANGGADLDFYALDGYTNVSNSDGSATGYRTASQVFTTPFSNILSVVPGATLAITEANCETYASRAQWFADLWALATSTFPCAFVMPFFAGQNSGDVITYNTSDSPAPGTVAQVTTLARAAAQP